LSEGKFAVRCSSPLLLVWAGSFGFELVEANSPLLLLWAGSFGFELVEADLGSANFLDEEGATRGFFVATAVDMMGAAWGGATGVEEGWLFSPGLMLLTSRLRSRWSLAQPAGCQTHSKKKVFWFNLCYTTSATAEPP
jgi:hypothetical protein